MESLIYNRKATDFYNVSDLNRVEDWVQHLYYQLKAMGYAPVVKSKTKWDKNSIPRQSAIDAIRKSITALKDTIFPASPDGWRDLSVGNAKTNAAEWDAWEWDLSLISGAVDAMIANGIFRQANTIFMYSGGELV